MAWLVYGQGANRARRSSSMAWLVYGQGQIELAVPRPWRGWRMARGGELRWLEVEPCRVRRRRRGDLEMSTGAAREEGEVEVTPKTGFGAVPHGMARENFPVLLRVTASEEKSSTPRHVGVDIVAVLDISGSMFGDNKLECMKDAMKIVIDKLGPKDRLSIVSFESTVDRLTELTYMSDQGQVAARNKVDGLFTKGGTNMGPALHEGAQILRNRRDDEKSSRVGCILFLSDGLDGQIYNAPISNDFPAHTFGLGADHDPKALKHIADKTNGTYSFANKDVAKIKDAFNLFIAGLTSVTATSVEITLRAHKGAVISRIHSGGYSNEISPDECSGKICIDNMYAGEKKNFIVYLKLQDSEEGKQKLLTVGGRYRSLGASKNLATTDVSVMRPKCKDENQADVVKPVPDYAKEAARNKLFTDISDKVPITETAEVKAVRSKLEEVWKAFENSKEAKDAPETTGNLKKHYEKMKSAGIDDAEYQKSGLPYLLSWLTSHKWQRATTKNEPESPGFDNFLTPKQQRDIQESQEPKDGTTNAEATNNYNTTTTWEKIRDLARSQLGSFLLLGVAVILTMLYSELKGGSMARNNTAPLQYPMLSKSNYAAWAIKMEAYICAQGVWDAIEAKDPNQVPTRKNHMALAAIYQAIPEGTLFLLSGKKTAKSAWEALKTMNIGAKRLRDAKLQTFRLQFEGLRMKESESVDEFAVRLTTVVNKIQSLGENIEESYAVKKFLRAVPGKFLQIASAIEQFGDLETMTLEEVIARLKVHEERLEMKVDEA